MVGKAHDPLKTGLWRTFRSRPTGWESLLHTCHSVVLDVSIVIYVCHKSQPTWSLVDLLWLTSVTQNNLTYMCYLLLSVTLFFVNWYRYILPKTVGEWNVILEKVWVSPTSPVAAMPTSLYFIDSSYFVKFWSVSFCIECLIIPVKHSNIIWSTAMDTDDVVGLTDWWYGMIITYISLSTHP